ncbi:hypothetical protein EUTSA_v10000524mg [Eutrema salsugineum]|uniref:DUF1985 domain-containing protein n=1 Tax=Eutrema salsugineum TaxID=72664 RepID=V4L872_EUTSA|nr:hypothetical protein EUTSA_v10000524mg [Eutrema salsugineum]
MDEELPKLLFEPSFVNDIDKINNRCILNTMDPVKKALSDEYKKVLLDPVFGPVLSIIENDMGYSGRLIHSFLCKELITDKKHELCDWVDDGGFWSKLLRSKRGITLSNIETKYLGRVNKWTREDRLRLVYLYVIASLVMAKSKTINIPKEYIILVMDLEKLRKYPWGRVAFNFLVQSIKKVRVKLTQSTGYALNGFSIPFQIWIMEAIPVLGYMLSSRLDDVIAGVARYSKWNGISYVKISDIKHIEHTFRTKEKLYHYISSTGNDDVVDSLDFVWPDEMADARVDRLKTMINDGMDWSHHNWAVEEAIPATLDENEEETDEENENVAEESQFRTPPAVASSVAGSSRGKKRVAEPGAETRKQKLMCDRSAAKAIDGDFKSFIQGLLQTSLKALEERLQANIDSRVELLEKKIENIVEMLEKKIMEPIQAGTASDVPLPAKTSTNDVPIFAAKSLSRTAGDVPLPAKTSTNDVPIFAAKSLSGTFHTKANYFIALYAKISLHLFFTLAGTAGDVPLPAKTSTSVIPLAAKASTIAASKSITRSAGAILSNGETLHPSKKVRKRRNTKT